MAQALLLPLLESGQLRPDEVCAAVASDASAARLRQQLQLRVEADPLPAWRAPVVLLAVKPQQLDALAAALAAAEPAADPDSGLAAGAAPPRRLLKRLASASGRKGRSRSAMPSRGSASVRRPATDRSRDRLASC